MPMDALPATRAGRQKWGEIAGILKRDRSPQTVTGICESYNLDREYVEGIAEGLVERNLIFESAPPSKGPVMPSKPSLGDQDIEAIFKIVRKNGRSPGVLRKVAQQYKITESLVGRLAAIEFESKPKVPTITESTTQRPTVATGVTSRDIRESFLTEELQSRVNLAESRESPAEWSHQEIEALAAAYFPR